MDSQLAGIGKKERANLSLVLKAGLAVITPKAAAKILNLDQSHAAQLLALWAKKGWLSRIKQGVYIPVALQADSLEVMADEPWVIAKGLFEPCYIGGWSAAEHWNFTEQIFNSTMVFTTKQLRTRELSLKGIKLSVKTIKSERLFGTKPEWIENQKVLVSDPTRTIVDSFNDPAVVGGIRMAIEILDGYLKSEYKNLNLLFQYSIQMKNTAIFKRMGFVFEQNHPSELEFIKKMKSKIKSGFSQLDPSVPGKRLVTAWNIWVPSAWKKGFTSRDQS